MIKKFLILAFLSFNNYITKLYNPVKFSFEESHAPIHNMFRDQNLGKRECSRKMKGGGLMR